MPGGTLAARVQWAHDHIARRTLAAGLVALMVAAGVAVAVTRPWAGGSVAPPSGALELGRVEPGSSPRLHGLTAAGRRNLTRLLALGRPIYCGARHGHAVAFTFDDGPGVYTHYALRKLRQAGEQATFFVVGRSVEAWPGWLRRETRVAALGDHTMTHRDLVAMAPHQAYREIARAKRLIQRDSGQRVELFRPPYGAQDRTVTRIARRLGMLDIMWSVDSADSLGANYAGIIHNVERGLRPGAIVELHENRGQTIRALTTLLPALRRRHLHSVSVLTLLASDPPSVSQLRRGEGACGTGRRGAE